MKNKYSLFYGDIKKEIFNYNKGDIVPGKIIKIDNPCLTAIFNVDVDVIYNIFQGGYTTLIKPKNFNKPVIIIKNNGKFFGDEDICIKMRNVYILEDD